MHIPLVNIEGIAVLDTDGDRIAVKYMSQSPDKKEIESYLIQQWSKQSSRDTVDFVVFQDYCILYTVCSNVMVAIIGSDDENEVLLRDILNNVVQACTKLYGSNWHKGTLRANLEMLLILLDETLEGNMVFELNSSVLVDRVRMSGGDTSAKSEGGGQFNKALLSARESIIRNLLSS
eukprot:GHVO01017819.1.p1 GENE.GHVO01017819.1~~GHVO01017819.1.p1  ORF type:complete len:177 (+),score=25.71 GHVO01017819.1:65-595(+)